MFPLATILCACLAAAPPPRDEGNSPSPFTERGYYITFMRMPSYDLADWKRIVAGIHDDCGNLLLLWVAGAFRSHRFPITWRYNRDHENVRHDFVRDLIDYAHEKGVRVLLGFTPFGDDGVNQYTLEHPELKAIGRDGKPVGKAGIGCWGYNLCPSREESQRFQLDYVREMIFEFYPNADGLMIESSDYAICRCKDCGERFFDREFSFVNQVSEEVWGRKPQAMVVVYPHYFSGATVPGFGVRAARQPFDPRWTLFFTPHSAHIDPALVRQARHSLWWDEAPALRRPGDIQAGARRARQAGVTGYIPSLEAYGFLATEAEENQPWLKGRRQVPLGFGWLAQGDPPYDELPMRVNRIAYREFTRDPELPFEAFRQTLGRDIFGASGTPQAVDDLLDLQAIFAQERTWCRPSPLVCPDRVRAMVDQKALTPAKQAEYRTTLDRLRSVEERHRVPKSDGEKELHRIACWVLDQWKPEDNRRLLDHGP